MNTIKKNMHALVFVIGACLPVMASVPVHAQDVQSRIQRLENEIDTLSRAVFKGEQPPEGYSVMSGRLNADAAAQANIELRLSQLENEMRSLTGKLEEISFQNRQFQSRIEKDLADMKLQLEQVSSEQQPASVLGNANAPQTMAGGTNPALNGAATIDSDPPPMPSGQAGVNDSTQGQLGVLRTTVDENGNVIEPEEVPAEIWPTDPAGLYERAFSYLRERNYEKAAEGFALFIEQFPTHDLAGNSKYWLGETYYVRQQYERAAREFAQSYQNYPEGSKGPDSLLKLAMSLKGMGKNEDACLSLQQLESQYPDAPSSITIRAQAEAEELDCN